MLPTSPLSWEARVGRDMAEMANAGGEMRGVKKRRGDCGKGEERWAC